MKLFYHSKRSIAFYILSFFCSLLSAQTFTEQTAFSLTGVSGYTDAWGDYNNDGYPDLLVAGNNGTSQIVKLYKNEGGTAFTWQTAITFSVGTVYDAAWADYDNDGDLDILIASTGNSKLYENKGNGTFEFKVNLPEVFMGKCAWADLDNDGYRDIVLTGSGGTHVLKNNHNGTFTEKTTTLPAVGNYSSVACGDYDNDGDFDILIAGLNSSTAVTKVFSNGGGFAFTEQTGIVLPGISNCAVAWADIDNNGLLDIVLSGGDNSLYTAIYTNSGSNTFTIVPYSPFMALNKSCLALADYDNDGYKDFIVSGTQSDADYIIKIYHNNKNKTFTEVTTETLPGVQYGTVKFADYDNDGKLDLFINGNTSSGKIAKIYKNGTSVVNTSPTAPTNLQSSKGTGKVNLNWTTSTDAQGTGLSYNLYIYRMDNNASYIYSPQSFRKSEANNGKRLVAKTGDIQKGAGGAWYTISGLPDGNYKWSVQAIDPGLRGGEFAAEASFVVADEAMYSEQTAVTLDPVNQSAVAWGDYNNDGYADILLTGNADNATGTYISKIYKNNGNGTFTWQQGITLTGVSSGAVAWADFNNDNYLDILLTGHTFNGPVSIIYKNNGNGTFTEQTSAVLPKVEYSAVACADYNNDGYQDIFITGKSSAGRISMLFKNNRNGSFTEQIAPAFPGVNFGAVAWGDFNNDGFQDLLLTGRINDNYTSIANIYKNNGDGTFTKLDINLSGANDGSVAWGDYNSDGLLDFAITGQPSTGCSVYKNNGDETFQLAEGMYINTNGTLTWGDYNNDGFPDLLSIGSNGSNIYRNTGDNSFEYLTESIPDVSFGSPNAGFCDYDNDGKIDLLLTGSKNDNSGIISKLYKNVGQYVSNTNPATPANLAQTVSGSSAKLSWDKATDKETPRDGLSYNIYVKNATTGEYVKSPQAMSDASPKGHRLCYQAGEIQKGTGAYTLKDLPTGTYKWSVQSVDGINAGSEFATESSFSIVLGGEIDVNVAENLLVNTRTDIEYSINSTNGTDGTWLVCTAPNTSLNYGTGGFDVWIRLSATPANTRKVATIASPAAAPAFTINFTTVTTNEAATKGTDYSVNADMSASASITGDKVPVVPGRINYIRTKATATTVASNIQQLNVPARPAKPAYTVNFQIEYTNEHILSTDQYSTVTTMVNPKSGTNEQIKLVPGVWLYFRTKSTATSFASDLQTLVVPERPSVPSYTIDYINEQTKEAFYDMYNWDGNENNWSFFTNPTPSSYLLLTPGKNVYISKKITDASFRSDVKMITVPARPAAPTNPVVDDAANTFGWTYTPLFEHPTDYEITTNGSEWNTCTAKPFNVGNINISAGGVKVRVKAGDSNFKGEVLASNEAYLLSTYIKSMKEAGIRMYPNPVSEYLYLENIFEKSTVSIYTAHGKQLKQETHEEGDIKITVADLPSGLYIVRIKTEKGEFQAKFSKQ